MSSIPASQQLPNGGPPRDIPDALLERMMDRKLVRRRHEEEEQERDRMLDLEYEECLKATKSRNIEDYDQGPTGDEWDKEIVPDPEAVRAAGYEPFGGSPSGVLPNDYDGADPRLDVTLEEDEWSEAWAEYKKECAEEEEDARNKGITDDDVKNQTAPDEPALAPKPLSQASLSTISSVMSGIKLKPPMWALHLPEEVWMSQILSRAGFRPPTSTTTFTAAADAKTATAADDKKKHKKKKKKSKKTKAAATAPAAPTAADDFDADFSQAPTPIAVAAPAAATATANDTPVAPAP